MQKLAEVCIKRPVFATMLVMAFVVVGAASWFRLGVDRFPAVDLPTVNVRVELPGASSEGGGTQGREEPGGQDKHDQGNPGPALDPGAGRRHRLLHVKFKPQI